MRFRLGSTSYVYPAGLLANVRQLAGVVEDVELVLFEAEGASNLPDAETVAGLREVARRHRLTYTVHLPTDLRLGAQGEAWASSVEKARRFIQATRPLNPWAYIVHLNPEGNADPDRWQEQCLKALATLAEEASGPDLLAVENLENCPLERLVPILERIPVRLCLDVGHLWRGGVNPLPALEAHLERTRVVHLHGVNRQDHESLLWAPADSLRAVLKELVRQGYEGVVTLEVFSAEDFFSSRERVLSLLEGMERWEPDSP
ncbi:MAG: sugar phosphate isomerase/epimerase, partial [Thermoflexales bacterium]|nr:sugar phosphate isomerase/epimerase [Thermoflexales bacterium]